MSIHIFTLWVNDNLIVSLIVLAFNPGHQASPRKRKTLTSDQKRVLRLIYADARRFPQIPLTFPVHARGNQDDLVTIIS
jgi:hypothetical protein